MDPVTLSFYGIVCGTLGLVAPALGSAPLRLVLGAAIGLAAAAMLPVLRGVLGL